MTTKDVIRQIRQAKFKADEGHYGVCQSRQYLQVLTSLPAMKSADEDLKKAEELIASAHSKMEQEIHRLESAT